MSGDSTNTISLMDTRTRFNYLYYCFLDLFIFLQMLSTKKPRSHLSSRFVFFMSQENKYLQRVIMDDRIFFSNTLRCCSLQQRERPDVVNIISAKDRCEEEQINERQFKVDDSGGWSAFS